MCQGVELLPRTLLHLKDAFCGLPLVLFVMFPTSTAKSLGVVGHLSLSFLLATWVDGSCSLESPPCCQGVGLLPSTLLHCLKDASVVCLLYCSLCSPLPLPNHWE